MRGWWERIDGRERRWLAGGAAAVLVVALAGLLWWPLQEERARLAQRVEQHRQTLAWMLSARERLVGRQVARQTLRESAGDKSLLALVDAGVRRHGFEDQLRRAEPAGDTRVRLWLTAVPFASLVQWLESLQQRYGVSVKELRLERTGPGQVEAQLVLHAAGRA